MPTLQVKDANSATQTVNTLPDLGRTAAAASTPMAMSTEDLAALTAVNTALGTVNTNLGTVNTNLGTVNTNLGAQADAAATTDGGTFSLIALIKRGLAALTTSNLNTSNTSSYIGAGSSAAATADTGTFTINALIKRALAGITTLISLTAKGVTAKAAAQSVNPASDADPFPILVFQPTAAPTVLAVSTTSVNGALPAGAIIRISNGSSVPVCVAFGNSGIVATNSDMDVLPGNAECFRPPAGATHIAAIMAQGTTTLKVTPGNGA